MYKFLFLFLFFLAEIVSATAQQTIISGKVTDASNGEPMGYVKVFIKGTSVNTVTDFDGNYSLTIDSKIENDTISVLYLGYKLRKKKYIKGQKQILNIQIEPTSLEMQEVVVRAKENPAYQLIRKAVINKKLNDRALIKQIETEQYSKIEIDIDHISNKMKKRKAMREIAALLDSMKEVNGDDGKHVLPFYMTETIKNVYVDRVINKEKELIVAQKKRGVGLGEGTILQQLIEQAFIEYDFNQNWVMIVNKNFVSPIADGWKMYYEFYLEDSMFVDKDWCYKIEVTPKNPQDLAFKGHIWITDSSYALKRVDLVIDKTANLNFVDLIKIKQELDQTASGPWYPARTRILLDIEEPLDSIAGMIAKYYISNKDVIINQPHTEKDFFDTEYNIAEDAQEKQQSYWDEKRHEKLNTSEKNVYQMIDTLNNLPTVKTYIELIDIAINGYKRIGYFNIGPYLYLYNHNNVEGHRVRLGFVTNFRMSNKLTLKGYLAYGTKDKKWKYSGGLNYIFSKNHWTELSISHTRDIEQLGFETDLAGNNALFLASTRNGMLRRPYWFTENTFSFESEIKKGITPSIHFKTRSFDPLQEFYLNHPFAYYKNVSDTANSPKGYNLNATEIAGQIRLSRKEIWIRNGNNRMSLGTKNWPVLTLRYAHGFKGLLGGSFDYNKININVVHRFKTGFLGYGRYNFNAGYIHEELPYPLLRVHLGNETPLYNRNSFNLMNYFEFVSDRFVSIEYAQHLEGLLFNKIPLLNKLKWREVLTTTVLWGGVKSANENIMVGGVFNPQYNHLTNTPYWEAGYGIENIFKFLRIEVLHRLTYNDEQQLGYKINRWGLKFSAQFTL